MRTRLILAAVAAALMLGGCAMLRPQQPELRNVSVAPEALRPGDSAVIRAQVRDPYDIVAEVAAVVEDRPDIRLRLRDDGLPPDDVAGDNRYAVDFEVPLTAQPGTFRLLVTAFTRDGRVVPVRDERGHAVPLQVPVSVTITLDEPTEQDP